ncbi:MAG TPA: amidohydrolase family protein [Actinomycetota bacterium]|nr:amidohydrolase family protein [Actinomycetota bacterium]
MHAKVLLAAISGALMACASGNGDHGRREITVIVAGSALIGPELRSVDNAVVVLEGDRITAAGPRSDVEVPDEVRSIDASGTTLVPGFIDAHVHLGFYTPQEVLRGGVTTVRDLGWPPEAIFDLVRRSQHDLSMPRVLAAGPMLTAPGGYPTRAAWAPPGTGREIASAQDARRAVDELAGRGAAVIKVALHPGVGPTLNGSILKSIVEHAHDRGLKVTGHISSLVEVDKALDAGVDELAHMLMNAEPIPSETIDRMVAAEVAIVPTLSIRRGYDHDVAVANLARFLEAGGTVVYGTDLGNEGPRPGIDPLEIGAMLEAGMHGRAIVASATVEAARWLGLDDLGYIAPGMQADLVAVRGNPVADPLSLADVTMVWRAGQRVR